MKFSELKNLFEVLALFAITFFIVLLYSVSDFNLTVPEFTIQKSSFSKFFASNEKTVKENVAISENDTVISQLVVKTDTVAGQDGNKIVRFDTIMQLDTISKAEFYARVDTSKQRILLIGDSMLEGLMRRLKDYTEYNGHDLKPVIWYSSTTEIFGRCDTLAWFVKQFNPTYVIMVLGANELFIRNIKENRDKYVKNILKQIGNRKYIWVGPPNWKDDTGINDMILENVGSKRFFPSKNLKYKRGRDGAHPVYESSYMWMDSITSYIMKKSMYKIRLDVPPQKTKKTPGATLLSPLR